MPSPNGLANKTKFRVNQLCKNYLQLQKKVRLCHPIFIVIIIKIWVLLCDWSDCSKFIGTFNVFITLTAP